jgi:branched-chain amino acid transport system permease protein
MRILSFVLGAALAGIAGGLWVHLVTLISPSSFSFILAFEIVVTVVLGGTGSITGAVLVATVLSVLTQLLRPVEEAANLFGASQMIVALVVLIVLITRPKGLFGTAEPDLVGWLLRPFRKSKAA